MDQDGEYGGPQGYVFAVAENPYCCWDFDHVARSLEFLDGLNTDYFGILAELFADRLETDDALAVSVVLRVSYHQGLETLMSLLGALVQAPLAIPAWIAKCSTGDLKEVTSSLRDRRPILTQAGRLGITFAELAELVHRFAWQDETGDDSTAAAFGRFWSRMAGEFLDVTARAEYNALKHGNRVAAGGFTLSIGVETVPGVPAPADAMRSMGGSEFGSTFFVGERVGASKHHIRTRRTSLNWSPKVLAQRLYLVSLSIANIVGALRCDLGVDPTTVQFVRPTPPSAFDDVWVTTPGVTSFGMDSVIQIGPEDECSRSDLLEILENRKVVDPPVSE